MEANRRQRRVSEIAEKIKRLEASLPPHHWAGALKALVYAPDDQPQRLEKINKILKMMAPERIVEVKSVVVVERTITAKALSKHLSFGANKLVYMPKHRYVLHEPIVVKRLKQSALIGEKGMEIFVGSGQAVMQIEMSQEVLIDEVYMNHHDVDVKGKKRSRLRILVITTIMGFTGGKQ